MPLTTNKKAVIWNLDWFFLCWHDEKSTFLTLQFFTFQMVTEQLCIRGPNFRRTDFPEDWRLCSKKNIWALVYGLTSVVITTFCKMWPQKFEKIFHLKLTFTQQCQIKFKSYFHFSIECNLKKILCVIVEIRKFRCFKKKSLALNLKFLTIFSTIFGAMILINSGCVIAWS